MSTSSDGVGKTPKPRAKENAGVWEGNQPGGNLGRYPPQISPGWLPSQTPALTLALGFGVLPTPSEDVDILQETV